MVEIRKPLAKSYTSRYPKFYPRKFPKISAAIRCSSQDFFIQIRVNDGSENLKSNFLSFPERMIIIRKKKILVNRKIGAAENSGADFILLCPHCGEPMTDARELGAVAELSLREIFRLVEARQIHFYETEERIAFVCLKSIGGN